MSDKIIQLGLPLVWHQRKISTWRERHHVSSVSRPTEDAALDNIYFSARAMHGNFGGKLNGLEKKVYFYELRSYDVLPNWYTEADRVKWIATKTGLGISSVKDILHGVKTVLKELVRIRDLAIDYQIKDTAMDILRDLSAEYEARKVFLAA